MPASDNNNSARSLIERLEQRTLLAFSSYAQLISQDNAIAAYGEITGAGQTVAVIDTGIDYTHPSLGGGIGPDKKVIAGYDFLDNDSDPMDTEGHGTSVAGVIAADRYTYQGIEYQGIAPDAKLVALRVGTEDSILDSNIEKALKWVIANHERYGITVVNLSLGSGAYQAEQSNAQLSDEYAQLAALNISVFAASGNSGRSRVSGNGVAYPAADANVTAVGSVTASDQIAEYTQRGTELDLLAPGDNIVTTSRGGGFETTSGTSFASPLIAGVAALVRQVASFLTPAEVTSIIRSSGVTNYDGDNETGRTSGREYSRVNVFAAVRSVTRLTSRMTDSLQVDKSQSIDSAYDPYGVLHAAYYDKTSGSVLVSTRFSNGKWSRPLTASDAGADAGAYLSLAIDQAGKPTVAFYDMTNKDLRLASLENGVYFNTLLDSSGDVGQYASIAFDASGQALVAYSDQTNADLKFASGNRRTGYQTSTVDAAGDVGEWASIDAVQSNGATIVAIAYADNTNGNLKYTRYSTAEPAWQTFVVDDLQGVANIDLSLAGGRAAIAYRDTDKGDVKYAYRNTDWFTETVADKGSVGLSIDLYYDSGDTLHIAYYNRTRDATFDATRSSTGIWSSTRIAPGGKAISVAEATTVTGQATRLLLDRTRNSVRALVSDLT
ncbi:MAG TPA: S8 family serine peptidase [Tepidisphaeraceae bacterium]|nr:S8 family serine peptidase [Tepidisphaeraceae bacterium]